MEESVRYGQRRTGTARLRSIVIWTAATMKQFNLLLLVASSLLSSVWALAAERPHYGGSLRIEMREAPQSLEPAAQTTPGLQSLSHLIFETLVSLDDRGRPQPL